MRSKERLLALAFVTAIGLAAAGPARAGERPKAVVELFTSQGCSSCPPADALLGELAEEPDVIALTLPVHYWDYLGWKDTLASPQHSERQRAYAEARGDRKVYTPQMVVNGLQHIVGNSRAKVEKAVEASRPGALSLVTDASLARRGRGVVIEIGEAAARAEPADVLLAWIDRMASVKIDRGENTGREIRYYNVVRRMQVVGLWSGPTLTLQVEPIELSPGQRLAVLVQAREGGRPGAILGAALSAPDLASAAGAEPLR